MELTKIFRALGLNKLIRSIVDDRMRSSDQWARVVMNRATQHLISNLYPEKLRVLEISGSAWQERMAWGSYLSVNFPNFDICSTNLSETFDLIIAEQVFEHLEDPASAASNVLRMLENSGHFLISTPFLIRIHNHPIDCYRWTETGLRALLRKAGFRDERIHTDSWGNRSCVKANFSRWQRYWPIFHSLKNEPDFPLVVWALAQKDDTLATK